MPGYQVNINMSPATVQTLVVDSYSLCAWKTVKTTAGGASPVVWFATQNFAVETSIAWEPAYQAYVTIQQSNIVNMEQQAPIGLGEIMQVNSSGIPQVVSGGPADAMSILNQTTNQYTSGISCQLPGVVVSPIVAAPLFGNMLNAFAPVEQVLLMFTSYPVSAGAIVTRAYAQGILIDAASENPSSVTFDINQGWSWNQGSWAQTIAAGTMLAPVLIQSAPLATGI